jgi:2-polyprenyl-3-methyl-5-hydroxy-6-metoxy-1,4-benzoquinol methylase
MSRDFTDGVPSREADVAKERRRLSPALQLDAERLRADQAAWLERTRATWNARAERWDARAEANATAPDRETDLDRIWTALALGPAARLLDAGCGSGQFAIAFALRGVTVTGVDLSPRMIRRAEVHARERKAAVSWRIGDISQLTDSAAVYDAIVARVLLPFVPDVPATLRELRRVLKPGGRLLASVPGALSPIYSASWMRHLPGGDPGNNYLVPWELERLLQEGGWRIVDGWGEWGDDLYGTTNDLAIRASGEDRALQQATATTWTAIAT